ncbi:hypothetical protein C0995_016361 [Termitomyces sp. Mi166|nr:hypothetical protein C0995_016361 [Termitomyces sp. Mi166\
MPSLPAPLSGSTVTETPLFRAHLQTDRRQPICSVCQVVRDPNFTALIAVSAQRDFRHFAILDFTTNNNIASAEVVESPYVDVEPLSEIMRRLELGSAHIHNVRLAARNALNLNGKLELLEKTVSGDGVDLANALKGLNMMVSVPMKPAKIRDRPKNLNRTGRLEDFTGQDILDLIVFYNNDFGIASEDDEVVRRRKLLAFLTGGEELER